MQRGRPDLSAEIGGPPAKMVTSLSTTNPLLSPLLKTSLQSLTSLRTISPASGSFILVVGAADLCISNLVFPRVSAPINAHDRVGGQEHDMGTVAASSHEAAKINKNPTRGMFSR